jgi:type II secretory pathway pseudopilin PulG
MPEDSESSQGNKKTESSNAGGVPLLPKVPPVPAPAGSHQLTSFPVALVILLHFLTCGIFSLVWLNLMHGKLPRVRSDDPSAGRAVGFCFIPFYNFYWIFFTYIRLCSRIDEQRERYGLPRSNLRGLAITNGVFQLIPYVNFLIGYTIITPIFIGLVQSSVNQLANKSATTAPLTTVPTSQQPASGMPGWAIALIVCGCLLIPAILAALLIPALVSARHKAQDINSINNLKEIGLAIRIWSGDNNDQYPWNVSQTNGGVQEICGTDADGYETNPVAVFMIMSNELATPKILVCADDPGKQPAPDFASLTTNNISYLLRTGTNVSESNPEEILAVDPINDIVLHCDGSVDKDLDYKSKF